MALDAKVISRTNAEALIPVEYSREILQNIPQRSKLLPLMRRLPNMSAKQRNLPVLSALPTAYFLNGDTEQKKTTNAEWDKVVLTAEELAVIIPIPEAVLDDSSFDIWGELRPQIEEAFGIAIDAAISFGTNKPTSWPTAIVPGAIAANNKIEIGTNTDVASDIIGVGGLMDLVESDGYRVNAFFADGTMEAQLRDLRDKNNNLLYLPSLTSNVPSSMIGRPIEYDNQGVFDTDEALMIAGDFTKAVYSIRQDMTYKVLDQAIIQNTDGTIAYNLAQQDMVALRCVMRLGVQIANPVTRKNTDNATRYPFAVLQPKSALAARVNSAKVNKGKAGK